MMKIQTYIVYAVFACSCAVSAQEHVNDPVVMTINGKPVQRSEFEYFYNKNGKGNCSITDYADLYANYRLKIEAAKEQHLDTLSSFKKEFETYRDKQLQSFLVDSLYEDSVALGVYARMCEQVGDSDLIKVAHIYLAMPPKADKAAFQKKKDLLDSIYVQLQNGADFAAMAKKYSEDYATAQSGGELPWIGPGAAIKEFEAEAYSLKVGQMSKPFSSAAGFHLILMKGRKKMEPYEEKRGELLKMLKAQGLDAMAANHTVEQRVKASGGTLTREDVMQQVVEQQASANPQLVTLINEYHDGLLLFEVLKRDVWDKAEKDASGLQNFFNKNKSKYVWKEPRFKGFLFHCKEPQQIKEVKKVLKDNQKGNWTSAVRSTFNSGKTPKVVVFNKLYKQGDNPFVDQLVFKKGEAKPMSQYPYADVLGKVLKKGPESYEDVRGQVVSDYQDAKEKEWVKRLREKAKIVINREVLKTIENH